MVFAGGTVTIALVSLAVAGIPLVTTMGLMAAIAVVVAVLAALTLLPAMLAITGPHDQLAAGPRPASRTRRPRSRALWARWAAGVARHPVIAALAALAILIPLAIPLLSLTLGQKDVAALSTSTTARRAYDLISDNFGPGVNGPLIVAVTLGSPAQASSRARAVRPAPPVPRAATRAPATRGCRRCRRTCPRPQGVAAVTPMQIDKAGTTAYFNAIAKTGPAEQATADLVNTLRSSVIPEAEKGTNMTAYVGGTTAEQCRPRLGDLQQAAAADPGRDRAQLPAADAGVPHGRDPGRRRR